jgi:hypothetical protein
MVCEKACPVLSTFVSVDVKRESVARITGWETFGNKKQKTKTLPESAKPVWLNRAE